MSPSRPRWRDRSSVVTLSAAMLLSTPLVSQSAEYPDRPITLVVPFGAGGITDLVARATGKVLSEQLGQSIVVENRPGAGGNIAADFVRRARPDGYTLMFATVGILAVNPHTDVKVNFDSAKDFTYISLVGSTPHLVVVGANVPAKTLPELIKLAQVKPDAVSVGTAGVGSSPYQGMRVLQEVAKVEFLHVPFKSGSESVTNVVSGQVNMTFEATPQVMPFVTSGKLRALAVANPRRCRRRTGSFYSRTGVPVLSFRLSCWAYRSRRPGSCHRKEAQCRGSHRDKGSEVQGDTGSPRHRNHCLNARAISKTDRRRESAMVRTTWHGRPSEIRRSPPTLQHIPKGHTMADTMQLSKGEIVAASLQKMQTELRAEKMPLRESVAETCRILFAFGHDSGLSGQITARAEEPGTYYTQRLGLGFDEITADNLLLVNEDLEVWREPECRTRPTASTRGCIVRGPT